MRATSSASSPRLAESAHWRSSRKSARGCSFRANTPMKRRNTRRNRLCASLGGEARAAGAGSRPMTSASGGMTSTMSCPLSPRAPRDPLPGGRDPLLGQGEDLQHRLPEGLDERGIGDVALVLIELPREEEAPLADDRPVQLADERSLADAGVSGDEQELGRARGDDPVERPCEPERPPPPRARRAFCGTREAVGASSAPPARTARSSRSPERRKRGTSPDRAGGRARSGSGPRASWRGASGRSRARTSEGPRGTTSAGNGGARRRAQ